MTLQGVVNQGKHYPGNTLVGCNAWVIHQRKKIFGDDCAEFKPKRWIEDDKDYIERTNPYFFAFWVGTRACIGRDICLLEIDKAVPLWLRLFDVSGTMRSFIFTLADRILEIKLVDPKKEWEVHNSFVVKQHGIDATFAVSKYPEQEKSVAA